MILSKHLQRPASVKGSSQNNACWGLFKPGELCILLQGLNAGGGVSLNSAPPTGGAAAYMEALAYALLTYNMAYTRPRPDEMHIDATPPAPLGRTHHPSLVLLQNYQLLIPYVHNVHCTYWMGFMHIWMLCWLL